MIDSISLGNLNQCHNAANKFGSVTQHVGQGMFGCDIHIRTYTGTDCTGDSCQVDLTNSDSCDLEAGNEHWASFELFQAPPSVPSAPPPPSAPQGPSGARTQQPARGNADQIVLSLSASFAAPPCCDDFATYTISGLDGCFAFNQQFLGFTMSVGQNLFGLGLHLYIFSGNNCLGEAYTVTPTNNPVCFCNGMLIWRSFMIVSPPSLPPPSSPPPSSPSTHPNSSNRYIWPPFRSWRWRGDHGE